MKKILLILCGALVALSVMCHTCRADWWPSFETNFTARNWTWWNTNLPARMYYIESLYCSHDFEVTTNNITLYRTNEDSDFYLIGVAGAANLQHVLFTPDGNGAIAVPYGQGLTIVQTDTTNKVNVLIDFDSPK